MARTVKVPVPVPVPWPGGMAAVNRLGVFREQLRQAVHEFGEPVQS